MKHARGFSLIEVLLATALLATGIALAFATLRNATVATERADAAARDNERLRAVQSFLRRQLEGALPLPFEPVAADGGAKFFEASRDSLKLVAPMPGYLSRGGPYLQTFRLVRGADGLQLVFQHELLTPAGPLPNKREPEVLLSGIAEGRFEFRTLQDDGEPTDWSEDWADAGRIPRLVRLRLRFTEPRAHWPDLVAAPRLGPASEAMAGALTADPVLVEGEQ